MITSISSEPWNHRWGHLCSGQVSIGYDYALQPGYVQDSCSGASYRFAFLRSVIFVAPIINPAYGRLELRSACAHSFNVVRVEKSWRFDAAIAHANLEEHTTGPPWSEILTHYVERSATPIMLTSGGAPLSQRSPIGRCPRPLDSLSRLSDRRLWS